VGAFLDGGFGEADENRFWERAGRDIDLDFDRHGLDANEGEGVELGEHGGTLRGEGILPVLRANCKFGRPR